MPHVAYKAILMWNADVIEDAGMSPIRIRSSAGALTLAVLTRAVWPLKNGAAIVLIGMLALAHNIENALAQAVYPSRPVTLVLSTPAGGVADAVARIIQPVFAKELSQTVVIENRPGAGGVLGAVSAAKSAADGHTILLSLEMHIINGLMTGAKRPYDGLRDFAPVSLLARLPNLIAAPAVLKASSLPEFIALAKAKQGAFNFGSPGKLTSAYLATEEFKAVTGTEMLHVTYSGGPQLTQALMRNDVQFAFLTLPSLQAAISSGMVTPLAVTGETRLKELPDTPTMVESGYSGYVFHSWIGAFVPAGTPDPIVKRLNSAFLAALADPETRTRIATTGFQPVASTPEEFGGVLRSEHDHWSGIVKKHNIRLD